MAAGLIRRPATGEERGMRHKNFLGLSALLLSSALAAGCSNHSIPGWTPGDPSAERARALVERSAAAHGGDVFAGLDDLSVSYEGSWGRVVPLMQPMLADKRYRSASEERYLLADETIVQLHSGPAGTKTVVRDRDGAAVSYDGSPVDEDDRIKSSALVADAYLMMITGPSWFLRPGVELRALSPIEKDGKTYDRVVARFRPGFGFSEEDRALLELDRETSLLHRVQFSIDGFRRSQGAEVDVTFSEHREIAGYVWPTYFVERVREPVSAFAHRWSLVGLDVDRGLTRDDLAPGALQAKALAPAGSPDGGIPGSLTGETPARAAR